MAEKLLSYFEVAKQKGGISAKVKLAMITKISSTQAASLPDSPDNIAIFETAIGQL